MILQTLQAGLSPSALGVYSRRNYRFGSATSTLRASHAFTSGTSTGWSQVFDMTTTSDVTAGNYVYLTLGMDAQTISHTYQYFALDLSIIAS